MVPAQAQSSTPYTMIDDVSVSTEVLKPDPITEFQLSFKLYMKSPSFDVESIEGCVVSISNIDVAFNDNTSKLVNTSVFNCYLDRSEDISNYMTYIGDLHMVFDIDGSFDSIQNISIHYQQQTPDGMVPGIWNLRGFALNWDPVQGPDRVISLKKAGHQEIVPLGYDDELYGTQKYFNNTKLEQDELALYSFDVSYTRGNYLDATLYSFTVDISIVNPTGETIRIFVPGCNNNDFGEVLHHYTGKAKLYNVMDEPYLPPICDAIWTYDIEPGTTTRNDTIRGAVIPGNYTSLVDGEYTFSFRINDEFDEYSTTLIVNGDETEILVDSRKTSYTPFYLLGTILAIEVMLLRTKRRTS